MPIVLASPSSVPSPPLGDGTARYMSWTGRDGVEWVLCGKNAVPAMQRGVKGLHMPRMDVFESSTPLVPGSDLLGYSIPGRPVYWPLLFRAQSADEWRQIYSSFFRSFHPVDPGVWTVGEGDDARTLPLTGTFDGSYSFSIDPFVTGWALIGIELYAPRPLWRGKAEKQEFTADLPVDFIPAAPGNEYHPSPDASFATATINNPGDEPAYLRWTVEGPASELELGVDGAVIEVPFDLDEGDTLIIDTDPAGQYATLNGEDVTTELGFQIFGPVPARGTSPLTITSSGAGTVIAELTPLYWMAF